MPPKVERFYYERVQTKPYISIRSHYVYKYQGDDVDENYCIWDIERMDKKMVYTAISRTTKWEYVHVGERGVKRKDTAIESTNIKQLKTYVTEYSKGKIYKITFDGGKIYIGQTCKELK